MFICILYLEVYNEEESRSICSPSLENQRLRTGFVMAFKIVKGEVDLSPSEFFLRPPRPSLSGQAYGLLQGPSRLRRKGGAFFERTKPDP